MEEISKYNFIAQSNTMLSYSRQKGTFTDMLTAATRRAAIFLAHLVRLFHCLPTRQSLATFTNLYYCCRESRISKRGLTVGWAEDDVNQNFRIIALCWDKIIYFAAPLSDLAICFLKNSSRLRSTSGDSVPLSGLGEPCAVPWPETQICIKFTRRKLI